jgi:CelD/BcsL family acetyltransferase involved in cellulose biosynthesis
VEMHPSGSLFHTRGWLEALRRTYGFQSAVLTTSPPGRPLKNGLVFCRVQSLITGNRLVSLPFSDHCEPLVDEAGDLAYLLEGFRSRAVNGRYKYAEMRPLSSLAAAPSDFQPSRSFCFHRLDLRPGAEEVLRRFHKDCVQRKIRRAEREGVVVAAGTSPQILDEFYHLMVLTRRRHGLPPQPLAWFRNLIDCLGDSLAIWVARKDDQPIAAIVTVRHGRTLTYKYGASDARFHQLGAMPCLFWTAIQDGMSRGLDSFDLGRSDEDNPGLIAFKDHLGAKRSTLSYWTAPARAPRSVSVGTWRRRLMNRVCSHLPERYLTALGSMLYRHAD